MRNFIALLFILVTSSAAWAYKTVNVGLFNGKVFTRCGLDLQKGEIAIFADDELIGTLRSGQHADISAPSSTVSIVFGGKTITSKKKIALRSNGFAEFKLTPVGQKATSRVYEGDVIGLPVSGRLQLVNQLDLERYVPGVIEAEGGSKHDIEYYKVQAIISRTYVCANLRRHEAEGFNVCDGTHCQVYHGRPRHEPLVTVATEQTDDIVIVDQNIDLITAAFHSNCGGHTVNAECVWSKPLSYCVGVRDTFCLVMPNSNWEKSVPADQWTHYLSSKRVPLDDTTHLSPMSYFPGEKQEYFVDSTLKIPTKVIRHDFKLKSAFFTVHQFGPNVTFIGQGFGHGVGLCQEGAMRMAILGYSYTDIVHFYYTDVHLIPLRFMNFFKEDAP